MLALVITVPREEVELISDRLWTLGVAAIEERGSDPVELWTTLGEDPAPIVDSLTTLGLRETVEPTTSIWWRWEEIDDSVALTWRQHVQEWEIVPGLRIVPAWLTPKVAPRHEGALLIDPGTAFGMGDHPTTSMSLALLLDALRPGDHVLDLGCGSGILGIAALSRGARHVTAIDISLAALEATRANALRNHVSDQVTSATELPPDAGPFDLIVANILTPTLIDLAPDMIIQGAHARAIIISGVLSEHLERVTAAFSPWVVTARTHTDGWVAATLQPPGHTGAHHLGVDG